MVWKCLVTSLQSAAGQQENPEITCNQLLQFSSKCGEHLGSHCLINLKYFAHLESSKCERSLFLRYLYPGQSTYFCIQNAFWCIPMKTCAAPVINSVLTKNCPIFLINLLEYNVSIYCSILVKSNLKYIVLSD